MADLRCDPGEVGVEGDGLFRCADGPRVILFRAVQSNESKGAGVFLFISGLLDAAQRFVRKNL